MPTVVTLVPLPMERDTRTIKIAISLARLGYGSVVVESKPSASPPPSGISRLSLWPRTHQGSAPPTVNQTRPASALFRIVREVFHFFSFLTLYFLIFPVLSLIRVPHADLYYLHEYRLYPSLWLLRKVRGPTPFVYDAHDVYSEVWEKDHLSPFWKHVFVPLLLGMERHCARNADEVVTVGNGVAQVIGDLFQVTPKVLRNVQDQRLWRPCPITVRKMAGLANDTPLLVVIGHRKPGMALAPVIEALAHGALPFHIAFVGHGYGELKALELAHGLSGRLHAVGPMPSEEMVSFVADADAALLPYFAHSPNTLNILPNGFFQSLAAGLPVLFPPLPEIQAVVNEHPIGWEVDPRDTQALIRAMQAVIGAGPERRRTMAEAARALSTTLTWEAEEEKLASLVSRLVG